MNIDFYTYSGKGGRPVNEDSVVTGENYFVVSDGLGGHDNGEIASGAAVRYISENYRSDISNDTISQLLIGADNAVKLSGEGGKATIAAIFTDGETIRIDNIGDSRVYYFRRGSIYFRTKDHSVCQASVDMGEMTDFDVRSSADRSGLFKVLGDTEPLKLPKPYETIDPLDGDAFLICSDGFWEHVYEMEMEADLLKSENANEWLDHMLKRLLLRSENNGDNFSAICGIIRTSDNISRTIDASESVSGYMPTMEIPMTAEIADSPKVQFKNKLIIICCAVIAVAAIGVIAAVLIMNNKDGVESSDDSSFSEQSSTTVSSSSTESLPLIPNIPIPSDTSDILGTSDESGTSDEPSAPDKPDTSEEPSASLEPETSDTTDTSDEPGTSDTPAFPEIPGVPVIPHDPEIPATPLPQA